MRSGHPTRLTLLLLSLAAAVLAPRAPAVGQAAESAQSKVYLPVVAARSCPTGGYTAPVNLAFELAVVNLHNVERAARGLPPLTLTEELTQSARRHSRDMASHNFVSHTGSDGTAPWDRMTEACYAWTAAGENIAAGYTDPASVMAGWMAGQGHRDNILNPNYRDIGVGYAYNAASSYDHYWTVDLGTRAGAAAAGEFLVSELLVLPTE